MVFLRGFLCAVTLMPTLWGQEYEDQKPLIPLMPEQIADSLRWDEPPDSAVIHHSMLSFQKPLAKFSLPDHPVAGEDVDSVVSHIEDTGRYWIAYLGAFLSRSPDKYTPLEFIGGLRAFESWLQQQGCLADARFVELVKQHNGTCTLEIGDPLLLHLEFRMLLDGELAVPRTIQFEIPDSFRPLF